MNWLRNIQRVAAFALLFASSAVLFAQAQSGNVYGTVKDDKLSLCRA